MPITVGACYHNGSYVYVEDQSTGLYWTKDLDNHGGSIFKTYIKTATELVWESDRNGLGDSINKHKSENGKSIPLGSLAPCNHQGTPSHAIVAVETPETQR